MKRFWDKVRKTRGCWLWTGAKQRTGYGWFGFNGSQYTAHRVSWILTHGPIKSSSIFVCHHCDNRIGVRPDHLFLGTHADNIRDREAKGRNKVQRGINSHFAKINEATARLIRKSYVPGSREFGSRGLSRIYGLTPKAIWNIAVGKSWSHL